MWAHTTQHELLSPMETTDFDTYKIIMRILSAHINNTNLSNSFHVVTLHISNYDEIK